jgi:hypothetical protein
MTRLLLAGIALAGLAGCVSDQQALDQKQPMAIDTAVNPVRFSMNCPGATGQVLSRQIIEPVINAPRYGGIERAEYTIGVEGCGQRFTRVVVCNLAGDGCFAAQ